MAKKSLKIVGLIAMIMAVFMGRVVWKGINGTGGLSFLLYLAKPGRLTETQYPITTVELEVENEGEKIRGKLFVPEDGRTNRELLIFSHGFDCQSQLLENKSKALAEAGIATMIFDFRGGSSRGQSDGDTVNTTVNTEISDLNTMIEYAKNSYDWVDQDRIYLMGESFGGLVSALTAAERRDVQGLILCFPAFHVTDAAKEKFKTVDDIPEHMKYGNMTLGKDYWETLWNLNVYEKISQYKGKTIIMHGTEDPAVDIEYSVKANQFYDNSELFIIEGAEHGFGGKNAKSTLKTVYHFIKKGCIDGK